MKQDQSHIHIWEAFEEAQTECPICSIERKTKERLVESIFGETVMDYDFQRSLGPKNSFCKEHFIELYNFNDKLGLAVIADRILQYEQQQFIKTGKAIEKPGFRKRLRRILPVGVQKHEKEENNVKCVLCRRIDAATHNSIKIMIDIWNKDEAFRRLYEGSGGFCLAHFEEIVRTAAGHKNEKAMQEFIGTTTSLQKAGTEKLHQELKWFIDKFDYRNVDKPWGSSKDALYRSLTRLAGYFEKPEEN